MPDTLHYQALKRIIRVPEQLLSVSLPPPIRKMAGAFLLFSPFLHEDVWQSQLRELQRRKATICGIDLSNFRRVKVQQFSQCDLDGADARDLVIVHGRHAVSETWRIDAATTIAGHHAVIKVAGQAFHLHLPPARLIAKKSFYCPQHASTFLVQLESTASLLGLEFDCADRSGWLQMFYCGGIGGILSHNRIRNPIRFVFDIFAASRLSHNHLLMHDNPNGIIANCGLSPCSDMRIESLPSPSTPEIAWQTQWTPAAYHHSIVPLKRYLDGLPSIDAPLPKVFAPGLSKDLLNAQLLLLQHHNATIEGIPLRQFRQVISINIATLDPTDTEPFRAFDPDTLVVLHGTSPIFTCPTFKRVTLAGSHSTIRVGDKTLDIEAKETKLCILTKNIPYPMQAGLPLTSMNVDALLILEEANLLGLTITETDCFSQMMHGKGHFTFRSNRFTKTIELLLLVDHCRTASFEGNCIQGEKIRLLKTHIVGAGNFQFDNGQPL